MEQITREEMIELLKDGELLAEVTGNIDLARRYGPAIAALQAAEPVGFGVKGLLTGKWDGRSFAALEEAESYEESALLPLFTLPCPPSKAQVPEAKPLPDLYMASYHEAIGWNACREAMLTASPASDPDVCTPAMEAAAEKYWKERRFKGLSEDPRTWKGLYKAMCAARQQEEAER